MKTELTSLCVAALSWSLCLAGCGGGQAGAPPALPPPPPAAAPILKSLSPSSAVAGGPSFTLTLMGSDFAADSGVLWGGQGPFPANFVSTSQLTFTPSPALTDCPRCYNDAGTIQIQVSKSIPGGGLFSNPLSFSLLYPAPNVTSLVPPNIQAGAAPLVLTLNGSGFVSDNSGSHSVVALNGTPRPAAVVSSTQVALALGISDLASPETAQITVANPTPGGGISPTINFTVETLTSNPVPSISSLSDTSAPAGWPGFPLTVNGTGFVAATTGQWDGFDLETRVLSSTQLKSAIPATDLATAGTVQVGLFNPSPGGGISNGLAFTINAVAPGAFGVIERSSLATHLTESDGPSYSPSISADGRFVVFASDAGNLVAGDTNGVSDVFLRDTCIGAPTGCIPSVVRVSVATDGTQADSSSFDAAISANGRYVAFASTATNLVPGVNSGNQNIFVHDTCFGATGSCTPATTLVSGSAGSHGPSSYGPSLTVDGRYVAYNNGSFADCAYGSNYGCSSNDFVTMVADTCVGALSGCSPTTSVVSLANDGSTPNNTNLLPTAAISADGRLVAFTSTASNLVAGDTNNAEDVFLRDTCVGTTGSCTPSTQRISVANDSSQLSSGISCPSPEVSCQAVSINCTGRFVSFTTNSTNVPTGNANTNVFVRDTCFGAPAGCTPSTTQVSLANDGTQPNSSTFSAKISADGRFVVFISDSTNLAPNDTSPFSKIFLRDTCFGVVGCTPSTTRLSVARDGTPADNNSVAPMLSGDSLYVVFSSLADNLAPGDTNQVSDIFVARTNVK